MRTRASCSLRSALAAAAVIAAATLPAPAGVPLVDAAGTPYLWDLDRTGQPNVLEATDAVTFYMDFSSLTDAVNGPKSTPAAIRDAIRAWEVPGTRIRFSEDTSRPASSRNGTDRVNRIGWSSSELSAATFAATFPTREGSRIVDADVVLNDRSFSWDTWNPGVIGDADIQALVTHEWGHAIGCDHVPLRASTMYYSAVTGQVSLRTLEPDDAAIVASLYPSASAASSTGTISGRVDVQGTKDDRAVHVVAVSVASMQPAASALTSPDGTFAIPMLPPGAYRLVAAPCIPLGNAMNAFWRSGSASFLPAVLRDPSANPGAAVPLRVEAGLAVAAEPFTVGGSSSPLEPNDAAAEATPIRVGDAICARFESGFDEDWYAFDATAGERLTASVLAWEIGSDADPALRITDSTGTTTHAFSFDIRNSSNSATLAGDDRDARIAGWTPPSSGRYLLRLTQDRPAASSHTFYVLFLTVASDAPSRRLTTLSVTRDRIDAGGTATTQLIAYPLREDGTPLGSSASVTFLHDGAGAIGPVTTPGDGTHRATLTSAATPGAETVVARVSAGAASADALQTARVVYVGPADTARTTFRAKPRRIGRNESAKFEFTPRDASGELLGSGRTVSFTLTPALATAVGSTTGDDAGGYAAQISAGDETGASVASATVDSQGTVATAPFAVGFALPDVLSAATADVTAFVAVPGLPKGAARAFAGSQTKLAAAASVATDPAAERTALTRTLAALRTVATGLRRAGTRIEDPGTPRELALSIREVVEAAIARAAGEIRNDRDQGRLDRARRFATRGSDRLARGDPVGAATFWLRAYTAIAPILQRSA